MRPFLHGPTCRPTTAVAPAWCQPYCANTYGCRLEAACEGRFCSTSLRRTSFGDFRSWFGASVFLGLVARRCSGAASSKRDLSDESDGNSDSDLDQLAILIEEARGADRRGGSPGSPRQRRFSNALGEFQCSSCREFKPSCEFNKNSRSRLGIQNYCKTCNISKLSTHHRTLRGTLQQMLGNARSRARLKSWHCSLSLDDLLVKLWQQRGRCCYSDVNLECLVPNSHWRISLERLNNDDGYTSSNCVLIAAEFNTGDTSRNKGVKEVYGSAQWSRSKVMEVPTLQNSSMDLGRLQEDIRAARSGSRTQKQQSRKASCPTSDGYWECVSCGVYKLEGDFRRTSVVACGIRSKCRECKNAASYGCFRTLRGNIARMLSNARARSAKRGQECTLTAEWLLDTLWLQRGRCFYSGVPLEYKLPNSDWRMSLERLNYDVGHTVDNCILVANEFNTSDHSRNNASSVVFGTAQWSRAKVDQVWGRHAILNAT
mmetsp:Transcript_96996/g.312567  ORF Transcript_96996/g.312567 Transcript_96996/m.312567 type:complete len:486 (-) Transcript_96996:7-1464(-)